MHTTPTWAPNGGGSGSNWPPAPDNECGLGLNWNVELGPNASWNPRDATGMGSDIPGRQKAVHENLILKPEETIMFTERVRHEMLQGSFAYQHIETPVDHLIGNTMREDYVNSVSFHLGTLNYIMVDGHVEQYTVEESLGVNRVGLGVQTGPWTMNGDD